MNKKLILLIDDDEEDRELFQEAITDIDPSIKCLTANDGEDALSILTETLSIVPDLIFVDINMPKMDGKKFLQHAKTTFELKEVPIIMYSTSKYESHSNEFKLMGAEGFIVKPYSYAELIDALKIYL
jgi:CheY-like chemotaxis protein